MTSEEQALFDRGCDRIYDRIVQLLTRGDVNAVVALLAAVRPEAIEGFIGSTMAMIDGKNEPQHVYRRLMKLLQGASARNVKTTS